MDIITKIAFNIEVERLLKEAETAEEKKRRKERERKKRLLQIMKERNNVVYSHRVFSQHPSLETSERGRDYINTKTPSKNKKQSTAGTINAHWNTKLKKKLITETTPLKTINSAQLSRIIGKWEGHGKSDTLATRNNNPHNLKFVGQKGAVKGPKGFAVFKDLKDGRSAGIRQIQIDSKRNLTLGEAVNKWTPNVENDTKIYLKNVVNDLNKEAGILDTPKKHLAKDVWEENLKLRPELRQQILFIIKDNICPLEWLDRAMILGSITGYKYTPHSDIDINLIVDESISEEAANALHLRTRAVNGELSVDGAHPINFFVKPYYPDVKYRNYPYGVYDIFKDDWKVFTTTTPDTIRDPEHEFRTEIASANLFKRRFSRLAEEFYKDNQDLTKLKGFQRAQKVLEIKEDLKQLKDMEFQVHRGRDLPYSWGWGNPRRSFRNIKYKSVEHGPYGGVMEALKSLRHSEKKLS